ncbi:hypothetical protein [Streptomyces sp. NPDC002851]
MEAELATLVATGATTLVGLMVTETWTQARERVVRFFARAGADDEADADADAVEEELRASRAALIEARTAAEEVDVDAGEAAEAQQISADIEAQWRLRLRRALRADPAAARELRALLDELAPDTGGDTGATGAVHNTISGGVQHGPVIQARNISRVDLRGSGGSGGSGPTDGTD